ncbi:response regulator [Winogradskyella haliclonae]|uniref:DNA-binding response regulator n=1 Tax=Winogradskyella haliclonae TaxID=2048558 RepID=A0ABQ2C3Z9_9FLAO|nr:response regulator [Winogradskyella haliclonae]GGI58497.1 DNA-binding response regulator [Winogradskyella haliclonae]
MCNPIHVLIVEDEPLIIDVLTNALNAISDSNGLYDFKIRSATNSDLALKEVDRAIKSIPFDLILLDISIPPSTDKRILSGEDLGIEIKSLFPKVKVMVFTSHNNNYRLNSILKSLDPDGFLIKSDITYVKLLDAINSVLQEPPYYSKAIQQLIRRHISHNFVLDKIDRQLLYHLYKGAKTQEIANLVHMSKSAIEHRKSNLKTTFEVDGGSDRDLILKAELAGFI